MTARGDRCGEALQEMDVKIHETEHSAKTAWSMEQDSVDRAALKQKSACIIMADAWQRLPGESLDSILESREDDMQITAGHE